MKTRSGSQNLDGASSHQHDQQHQMHTRQRGSNLGKALNYYDLANGNNITQQQQQQQHITKEESCPQQEHPQLMIQIPTAGSRIQTNNQQQLPTPNNNDNDTRNRTSTFGSEFDMSWAKERGMSISCLLTPMGEEDAQMHHPEVTTSGQYKDDTSATVSTSSTVPIMNNVTFHRLPSMNEEGGDTNRDVESDEFFRNNDDNDNDDDDDGKQKKLFSHTPPSNVATSYEQRHFQKRMRAGSISGRLRSASDLEDIGIISNDQKSIIKDLLIAGNDQVQAAIDKYESGDSSALEEMISSGAFSRSVDVDLLGDLDLDLDFLNVHEDDGLVFGYMDDVSGHDNNGSSQQQRGVAQHRVGRIKSEEGVEYGDDGIGGHGHLHAHEDAYSRIRTNSLALPGMMLDEANQDYSLGDFGHWMDSDLPNLMNGSSARQAPASSDAPMVNADGSSSSFKLQCDILMQSAGGNAFASSPLAVRSILMDNHTKPKKIIPPKKTASVSSPNLKKDKAKKSKSKKSELTDGKKSKKKSSSPNEAYSTESIPFVKREKGGDDDSDSDKEVPSGLGKPRSMSDPNLNVRLDELGLLHVQGPEGWVGAYSPDSREIRIKKFLEKRNHRVWVKKVKYDVRKNFADSRLRVKGRFVKKEDEMLMRELMSLT